MLQMWRKGRPITVQGDYIFGLDRQNFLNVGVIETRVTTDHMMVLACLRGSGDHQNRRYLWVCTIWSIAPLEGGGGGTKRTSGSKTYGGRSIYPRSP